MHVGDEVTQNAVLKKGIYIFDVHLLFLEHLTTTEQAVVQLSMDIVAFVDDLTYFKIREHVHRDSMALNDFCI